MGNSIYGKGRQVIDNNLKIVDEADQTKKLQWEVSGIASGTTVVMTAPTSDFNFNIPVFGVTTVDKITIDNIVIDGNDISSTSGNLTITPVAGSAVVIDGGASFDGTVLTGLTDLTSTNLTGTLQTAAQANITSVGALTNITPGANFTLTQNSVVSFTSVEAGAIANTLVLKAGKVGLGINDPIADLHIKSIVPAIQLEDSNASGTPVTQIQAADGSLKLNIDMFGTAADSFFQIRVDNVEAMSINSSGVVNISNLTASSDVQTDGSKNLISTSDERLKDIVMESDGITKKSIQDATVKLLNIEPIYYRFKSDVKAGKNALQLGFSAQNVNLQVSEAAYHDTSDIRNKKGVKIGSNDLYGFNSRSMLAVLVKGFQELEARVKILEVA